MYVLWLLLLVSVDLPASEISFPPPRLFVVYNRNATGPITITFRLFSFITSRTKAPNHTRFCTRYRLSVTFDGTRHTEGCVEHDNARAIQEMTHAFFFRRFPFYLKNYNCFFGCLFFFFWFFIRFRTFQTSVEQRSLVIYAVKYIAIT